MMEPAGWASLASGAGGWFIPVDLRRQVRDEGGPMSARVRPIILCAGIPSSASHPLQLVARLVKGPWIADSMASGHMSLGSTFVRT